MEVMFIEIQKINGDGFIETMSSILDILILRGIQSQGDDNKSTLYLR